MSKKGKTRKKEIRTQEEQKQIIKDNETKKVIERQKKTLEDFKEIKQNYKTNIYEDTYIGQKDQKINEAEKDEAIRDLSIIQKQYKKNIISQQELRKLKALKNNNDKDIQKNAQQQEFKTQYTATTQDTETSNKPMQYKYLKRESSNAALDHENYPSLSSITVSNEVEQKSRTQYTNINEGSKSKLSYHPVPSPYQLPMDLQNQFAYQFLAFNQHPFGAFPNNFPMGLLAQGSQNQFAYQFPAFNQYSSGSSLSPLIQDLQNQSVAKGSSYKKSQEIKKQVITKNAIKELDTIKEQDKKFLPLPQDNNESQYKNGSQYGKSNTTANTAATTTINTTTVANTTIATAEQKELSQEYDKEAKVVKKSTTTKKKSAFDEFIEAEPKLLSLKNNDQEKEVKFIIKSNELEAAEELEKVKQKAAAELEEAKLEAELKKATEEAELKKAKLAKAKQKEIEDAKQKEVEEKAKLEAELKKATEEAELKKVQKLDTQEQNETEIKEVKTQEDIEIKSIPAPIDAKNTKTVITGTTIVPTSIFTQKKEANKAAKKAAKKAKLEAELKKATEEAEKAKEKAAKKAEEAEKAKEKAARVEANKIIQENAKRKKEEKAEKQRIAEDLAKKKQSLKKQN